MRKMTIILLAALLALLAAGLFSSCGSTSAKRLHVQTAQTPLNPNNIPALPQPEAAWPAGLPVDGAQPWETLDGAGRVVSSINLQSQFVPGIERFLEAGSVSDLGEASRMASGIPGSQGVSWAIYRIPMGAEQPGTIAADVNLRLTSTNTESEYYIGVGDYSQNTWHWYGPFAVPHVRLHVPPAAYTSALGNLMLAVVAYDGADFDLVDLGVNARDNADTTPPPAPSAPTLTPVAGGVLAEWVPVVAADLAGYHVYANGNNVFDYIEGGTSTFIPATGDVAVTLSAVDVSGNESAQSAAANATPLTGAAPVVSLTTSAASGRRGDIIALNASGADSYDWDVDGDGTWDITGDTTGTAFANTTNMGIIRPALRAHAAGEGFWMGAVSLIIAGNSRPVVSVTASPQSGVAPLAVTFNLTAEDDDGTIAQYAWDFQGDGIFDGFLPANPSPLPHTYSAPGLYNAKFRVTDNEGSWDVETIAVNAMVNIPPVAVISASPQVVFLGEDAGLPASVQLSAAGSYSPMGDMLHFFFNPTGNTDTGWIDNGNTPDFTAQYDKPGVYQAMLKAYDEHNNYSVASVQVKVYRFGSTRISPDNGNVTGLNPAMCVYDGLPFAAFHDNTASTIYGSLAQDSTGLSWTNQMNLDAIGMGDDDGDYGISCVGFPSNGIGIAFINASDNNSLMYTYLSSSGSAQTNTVLPGDPFNNYFNPSLQNISGMPAFTACWTEYLGPTTYLVYSRAQDIQGSSWNSYILDYLSDPVTSLASSPDGPAVAYLDMAGYVKFKMATDAYGNSWSNSYNAFPFILNAGSISLAWLNGYWGVACWGDDGMSDYLYFARSTDETGTSWEFPQQLAISVADSCSLAWISNLNRAGIAYSSYAGFGAVRYMQASSPDSRNWSIDVAVHKGIWDQCTNVSLAEVDGLPGIAYYNASTMSSNFAYPRIN